MVQVVLNQTRRNPWGSRDNENRNVCIPNILTAVGKHYKTKHRDKLDKVRWMYKIKFEHMYLTLTNLGIN